MPKSVVCRTSNQMIMSANYAGVRVVSAPSFLPSPAAVPPLPKVNGSCPPPAHLKLDHPGQTTPEPSKSFDSGSHAAHNHEPFSDQDLRDFDTYEQGIRLKLDAFIKVGQAFAKVRDEYEHQEWEAFVEVGNLLGQIRDRRLYRLQYTTFGGYCAAKWPFKRRYANRLILGAQIFKCLGPIGPIRPHGESQVRPLYGSDLSEEARRSAWLRAIDLANGQDPTAKQVKAAVAEIKSPGHAPKSHPRRKKRALDTQAIKQSILNLLDKADLCLGSGKPKSASELLREIKEAVNRL